jgi:general secretion pathway protein E
VPAASGAEDLLDSSGQAPVIKLVNSILFDAIKARASDVHVQPQEDRLLVRQRIDGVLFDALTIPRDFQEEVVTRCKVLGRMNIAEKRLPQDGRASVRVGDRLIDLRIASLPTSFGERVVIRFLDKSARLYTLEELGMDLETLRIFRRLIKREHGLLLVTGPTGSGKSTTLYAALQEINAKDLNVLTLEDPIEYQLDGISQTQINEKKGMTFAGGLRNILRQDPDIIMVGEIRDRETAEMAIQSALTGHLVFSTLHTNDAASAVTRLLDLGIEPYLVASSLIAVIAQRLVRRVCPACPARQSGDATPESRTSGQGCAHCRGTGYCGRIGLFEQMEVTDVLQDVIQQRAAATQIRQLAAGKGMNLLAEDGQRKVRLGITTAAEVQRVTSVCIDT